MLLLLLPKIQKKDFIKSLKNVDCTVTLDSKIRPDTLLWFDTG